MNKAILGNSRPTASKDHTSSVFTASAIMAVGAIRKMPAVIETPTGDVIAIRHKMFLSHSYDHRIIDGGLGGKFVRAVADILEAWDMGMPV